MLVDSSVWCARLRYRASLLKGRIGALTGQEIREIKVRVVPRGAKKGSDLFSDRPVKAGK
jgi:hypothetical protein